MADDFLIYNLHQKHKFSGVPEVLDSLLSRCHIIKAGTTLTQTSRLSITLPGSMVRGVYMGIERVGGVWMHLMFVSFAS